MISEHFRLIIGSTFTKKSLFCALTLLSLDQLAQLLGGLKVAVFVDEGMASYGVSIWSFHWVFSKNESHEASQLRRSFLHLEVFSDDLGEFLLVLDIERILARKKFMRQCPYRPNIDLLIVMLPTEYLRR